MGIINEEEQKEKEYCEELWIYYGKGTCKAQTKEMNIKATSIVLYVDILRCIKKASTL